MSTSVKTLYAANSTEGGLIGHCKSINTYRQNAKRLHYKMEQGVYSNVNNINYKYEVRKNCKKIQYPF